MPKKAVFVSLTQLLRLLHNLSERETLLRRYIYGGFVVSEIKPIRHTTQTYKMVISITNRLPTLQYVV